jgi:4-amino-4-deoxychorismate lyase
MHRFIESIKIKDGLIGDIEYHNRRFESTILHFFKNTDKINLADMITVPEECVSGICKCRVLYSSVIEKIEFAPYQKREIRTVKLVHDNGIDYSFKYEDKGSLNRLKALHPDYDEILIIKNGLVTDTSFSNVAFFNGTEWHTPAAPLLKGTRREKLISDGLIHTVDIKADDIHRYKKISFINAMLDLGQSETDISIII